MNFLSLLLVFQNKVHIKPNDGSLNAESVFNTETNKIASFTSVATFMMINYSLEHLKQNKQD